MSKRDRQAVEQGLNDVLGGADLLGNVIQRDRSRRRASTAPSPSAPVIANTDNAPVSGHTSNMTNMHYDNLTSLHYDNPTDKPADKQASVQADRHSSGRAANVTDRHYDNQTDVHFEHMTSTPADKQTSIQADKPASAQTDNGTDQDERTRAKENPKRKQTGAALIEVRTRDARQMAGSPTVTVTLRLPTQMNQWLDEYVHGSWPKRVRKQELVAEALRMLFARRGRPGEAIFHTELLDKDSEP